MRQADSTLSQLMFSLIDVWKASGMTQKDFCIDKQINLPKFQYWMKKYSMRHGDRPDFVPVSVSGSSAVSGNVEVEWTGGKRIVFHGTVEASFLKALLS